MKKKILCFTDHYLPGFRAGGPIRSILNFVENLGDEFEIYIICNDRDMKDTTNYPNVNIDSWNKVGKASVFYASKNYLVFIKLIKFLNEFDYDFLYLNSFFSPKFTILPLLLRQFMLIKKKTCIICPRGNLSPEALKLKSFKKKIYLKFFNLLGLYQDLNWQASSAHEKKDIIRNFKNIEKKIYVVEDFTPLPLKSIYNDKVKSRSVGALRLLFLSRISPMKNLDFLLRVLSKVKTSIELSIYGPKEDLIYWKQCLNLICGLPKNINVKICDELKLEQTTDIFLQHDLFISPTRGEAFGNAIIESVSSGLPAIISDKTLWRPDPNGGIEVLRLEENIWIDTITKWSKLDELTLKNKRQAALDYANDVYQNNLTLKKNKEFFYSVL